MRTRVTAGLAAAAALALPLLVTSPAFAAGPPLPDGNHLYALPCSDKSDLYTVDPVTAALTVSADTDFGCVGAAAFDPTTGVSYAFHWSQGQLAPFVAATGFIGAPLLLTGGSSTPDGLAIGLDGKAFTTTQGDLYSLDLTTGVQTLIGPMSVPCLYAFSVDPTTGKFFAIQCSSGEIYEVNTTTALLTSLGSVVVGDPEDSQAIYDLRIDTSGRWWIESQPIDDTALWSFAGVAGSATPVLSGPFMLGSDVEYTEAILITWDPVLPATGLDGFAAFGLLGGGVLLLISGGVVLITARRTRGES